MPTPLDELRAQILIAPYTDMEPHVRRGAFVLVSSKLDLAEVALKMEDNDQAHLSSLIESGLLTKSAPEHLDVWRKEKRFFKFLIVQPFVIAQYLELPPEADPKYLN